MIKDVTKLAILSALEETSNQEQTPAELREEWAEKLANAIDTHVKTALRTVLTAGVSVPQDGGTSLKTTMLASIDHI